MKKYLISGIIVILCLSMGFLSCSTTKVNNAKETQQTPPPVVEKTEMELDFTLPDQHGNNVSLSDFKGNFILLTFSTEWCGACQIQANYMHKAKALLEGYNFVDIEILCSRDLRPEILTDWATRYNLETVLGDYTGEIADRYGIKAVPTNFVLRPVEDEPYFAIVGKWEGAFDKPENLVYELRRLIPDMFTK